MTTCECLVFTVHLPSHLLLTFIANMLNAHHPGLRSQYQCQAVETPSKSTGTVSQWARCFHIYQSAHFTELQHRGNTASPAMASHPWDPLEPPCRNDKRKTPTSFGCDWAHHSDTEPGAPVA